MSNFFRSGSGIVASSDYINKGKYVPQAHHQLEWFKQNISNSYVSRIFIGWKSVFTQKRESIATDILNCAITSIPLLSRKIFQHASACFWLENGKKLVVEYGGYNQNYDNAPYNTQIYYWLKERYGLRIYEDPYNTFFTLNDYLEIQFDYKGYDFNGIIDELCYFNDYSKSNYDLIIQNCQKFCKNLISHFNGKRFPGQNFRGNHTLTFMKIPADIASILEDNEKDESNIIGYFPIIGVAVDKTRFMINEIFN